MQTHADKTTAAPSILDDRSEHRPDPAVQAEAGESISASAHAMQLQASGEMANSSRQVKQTTQLSNMAHQARGLGQASPQAGQAVAQLQLATGPYRLTNTFFRTNLRDNDAEKTVTAKLPPRQRLMVIPNGARVSNFAAGLIRNEHSWVQTQNNGQGWIEDSMLEPAQFFNQAADQGSFIGNLNNRAAYLQELEGHVNLGSHFNPVTGLEVRDARIQEAAVHLNMGQNAQVAHIGNALLANPNPAIYDASIGNHAAKNALWQGMLGGIDAGLNTVAAPMSAPVKLKAKTALAQIISTTSGHAVMNQVDQLSTALAIPISYIEEQNQHDYNLYVQPQFGGVNGDVLQSLSVTFPPDHLFNDAQAFKRISDPTLAGHSDMGQQGGRISVSPADTDVLHEFTHALHYLTFEQRRRNAVANHALDIPDYRMPPGGTDVLKNQDTLAEARTIHRNQSFGDLGALAHGLIDPAIPAFQEQSDSFGRLDAFTQGIPTENDYRAELGLGARQDHRAMRVTNDGTFQQQELGAEGITSV